MTRNTTRVAQHCDPDREDRATLHCQLNVTDASMRVKTVLRVPTSFATDTGSTASGVSGQMFPRTLAFAAIPSATNAASGFVVSAADANACCDRPDAKRSIAALLLSGAPDPSQRWKAGLELTRQAGRSSRRGTATRTSSAWPRAMASGRQPWWSMPGPPGTSSWTARTRIPTVPSRWRRPPVALLSKGAPRRLGSRRDGAGAPPDLAPGASERCRSTISAGRTAGVAGGAVPCQARLPATNNNRCRTSAATAGVHLHVDSGRTRSPPKRQSRPRKIHLRQRGCR